MLALVLVFILVVGGYAIVRWVLPKSEGPIDLPSVSPVASPSPLPESPLPTQSAIISPSSTPTPTPTPTVVETVKTDDSYHSTNLDITIEKTETTTEDGQNLVYFVADIVCRDMSLFQSAFSGEGDKINSNLYEDPRDIAERNGALVAINCDNAGYMTDGIIVRGGQLFRFEPSDREMLMVYDDGTLKVRPEQDFSSKEEIAAELQNGLLHTFSFGPGLIVDGQGKGDYSNEKLQTWNPRTAVGMVEPGHFKFVVVDGRTEQSKGMRLIELENLMTSLGCTEAYNLDGGQSSILLFDGVIQNHIAGRETPRKVTDILYIAEDK